MKLTKEEALKLHRQMWTDMQTKLGDDTDTVFRSDFKESWCKKHSVTVIKHNCLLCEYAHQQLWKNSSDYYEYVFGNYCEYCPIDWPHNDETSEYFCEDGEVSWHDSPISEILALPEKEDE